MQDAILIRLEKKNEFSTYPKKQAKILNSFPEKIGYQVVYKPYGEQGRGFYYVKTQDK
jgi:hypothetical protein